MAAKRKIGERVVIGNRTATVESRPAAASGMQTIRYDDKVGLLRGFEWWYWRRLAEFPTAPDVVARREE